MSIPRKEHEINPDDIEINQFEFRLIMGDSWEHLKVFTNNIFCMCKSERKELLDYRIFVNDLNDVILKGHCSSCGNLAARYIETGEDHESAIVAERIKQNRRRSI